jgi:D-glycero-D-manno-heptose 1,7-bisphosphate phosphatase
MLIQTAIPMNKAVFLDKDGTLIPDIPYNINTALITLQDGAVTGLKKLAAAGYLLIVISNQAGVAYGYFQEADILKVKTWLENMLREEGVHLDGFYYCPHHPEAKIDAYRKACDCRKPAAGMLLQAAKDFDIELRDSWMIGDILNDVEAGHKAGCKSVLINNGNETEWLMNEDRKPDFMATGLSEAADYIIETGVLI